MCGIVGYFGSKPALSILIEGLEDLEYRGYDSTGLALQVENEVLRVRSQGPLDNLKNKIRNLKTASSVGIGHTRWATHGSANEANAHPHSSGGFFVVHNGVIENSEELKSQFQYDYQSETDTEVIAVMLSQNYSQKKSLIQTVSSTVNLLKGSFSFLVLHENSLAGVRKGPPLAVGLGKDKEFFISSDLSALAGRWTSRIFILENDEMFIIQKGELKFVSFEGKKLDKKTQNIQIDSPSKNKKGYAHYMLKEIFEQPQSVQKSIKYYIEKGEINIQAKNFNNSKRVFFTACGSSYYSALYGKYVLEALARIPVEVDLASEFQSRDLIIEKGDPVLLVSQSGETADVLVALKKAKSVEAFCISLSNSKHSSLDLSSDQSFYLQAGLESAVASTKSFTSSLIFFLMLALSLRKKDQKHDPLVSDILSLPSKMEDILSQSLKIKKQAESFKKYKRFLILGRGPHYPIALEGALKMKELAYIHAEAYPSGEMKHGPLALVDKEVLVIGLCSKNSYYDKNMMSLKEAFSRGANILTIGDEKDKTLDQITFDHIRIPSCDDLLTPLLEVIPLQLLTYYFACSLGHNVDRPRNLAKSVTVE